jgi:hypothetical protein
MRTFCVRGRDTGGNHAYCCCNYGVHDDNQGKIVCQPVDAMADSLQGSKTKITRAETWIHLHGDMAIDAI